MKQSVSAVIYFAVMLLQTTVAAMDTMELAMREPDQKNMIVLWESAFDSEYDRNQKAVCERSVIERVMFWARKSCRLQHSRKYRFFLPAYENLRIYDSTQQLDAKLFNVYLSNGTGLLGQIPVHRSKDGHSLIISPQSSQPLFVDLELTDMAGQSVENQYLEILVSRSETLNNLVQYPTLKWFSGEQVWLYQSSLIVPQLFSLLMPYQQRFIEVTGPARIQLKHRLQYEPQATDLVQDYRISYRIDDNKAQWLEISTGLESKHQIYINSHLQTVGRIQNAYIEIPAGTHRLELVTDRTIYYQVMQQTESDYLFPMFNQPLFSVNQVRHQNLLSEQAIVEVNTLARHLLRDNHYQSSAMIGQQILKNAALQRLDYPDLLSKADTLSGRHTYYRQLLPAVKQSANDQFSAYFEKKQLSMDSQRLQENLLSDQFQMTALKKLGYADFSPVAKAPVKDQYRLPKREVKTSIRIIVDHQHCEERHFHVQFDQLPPTTFHLRCEQTATLDQFTESLSGAALVRLNKELGVAENSTLSSVFSAHRTPEKMVAVAINEMELPVQVEEIRIWSEDQNQQPIYLALQIKESKPFQFSEQSYLARLHEFSRAELFRLLVDDLSNRDGEIKPGQDQLQNQWVLLKRYVTTLYRDFKSSVSNRAAYNPDMENPRLKNLLHQAQNNEQQQQWIDALSVWSRIVERSQGVKRDQALLSQADILGRLSENYLAESILRYLTLYGQSDYASQAQQRLISIYAKRQNKTSILKLAGTVFMQRPDQQNLNFLIQALVDGGNYRYALLLGLTTWDNAVLEPLLQSAYQLEWWQTYDALMQQLPVTKQWFWKGLKAQRQGDYQVALDTWEKAADKAWLKHLQAGIAIQQRLSGFNDRLAIDGTDIDHQVIDLYNSWHHWQQTHPGRRVWSNANKTIKDYAGLVQYYSVERDSKSNAFKADQTRPVMIKVMGPAKLKLQLRMLHDDPDQQLDTWIDIKDNTEKYQYPVINSKSVQGLEIVADQTRFPGSLNELEYQVGQGFHEIEISSADHALTVAVKREQAEFPLTVLAPLRVGTFAYALNTSAITEAQVRQAIPQQPSASQAVITQHLSLRKLLELPEPRDADQARQRMTQYLSRMQHDLNSRQRLLFRAEQIQQQFSDDRTVALLWNRIARYSSWQSVQSIVSRAGLRFIEVNGWLPSSTRLNVRKALISETGANQQVLSGDQRLVMAMTNLSPKKMNIEALLDDLNFLPDSPATLQYQIDTGEINQIAITRAQGWKKMSLKIPAGQHTIRFSMLDPVANQFLKLRFNDAELDMQVSRERAFFVSTHADPLAVHVKGPTTIRIDEWLSNKIISRYQRVASGWQRVLIPPPLNQQESLLIVKQRIIQEASVAVKSRSVKRSIKPVPKASILTQNLDTENTDTYLSKLEASLDNLLSDSGTWSFGTDSVRRNNVQEDRSGSGPIQFQQVHIQHRYFNKFSNTYWDTQGFARFRENGSPSFGLHESIRFQPDDLPFSMNLDGKLVTQNVDNQQEWTGQLKVALFNTIKLTPKARLVPGLSWFGRYLSLRNRGKLFDDGSFRDTRLIGKVDQDLYTIYKSQHTTGLSASFALLYDPWLDTRWSARIKSTSNEDMNLFIPDHVSTEAHWNQLIGEIDLDASVHINFYQKDNNRSSDTRRHFTKLKLNWQSWTQKHNRLEIDAQYNYDIDRNEHLGVLSLTYHFGDFRGYRDFKPGTINFKKIRERQKLNGYH